MPADEPASLIGEESNAGVPLRNALISSFIGRLLMSKMGSRRARWEAGAWRPALASRPLALFKASSRAFR